MQVMIQAIVTVMLAALPLITEREGVFNNDTDHNSNDDGDSFVIFVESNTTNNGHGNGYDK